MSIGRMWLKEMAVACAERKSEPSSPKERLAALDASIRRGLADAEAGRTKPAEDVFDRLERKYRDLVDH